MSDATPEFRTIAIVDNAESAMRLFDVAVSMTPINVGIMLRDAAHDAARTRRLAGEVAPYVPANVTVITNGIAVDDVAYVHLPFARIANVSVTNAKRVGVSVHSDFETRRATAIAHYLIASPVFATSSKPGARELGLDGLAELCHSTALPVFALGGIDESNTRDCIAAGAYGVAGIGVFNDPLRARRTIIAAHEASIEFARTS